MSSRFKRGFSAVMAVVSVVSSGQITPCIAAAADAVEAAVTKIPAAMSTVTARPTPATLMPFTLS